VLSARRKRAAVPFVERASMESDPRLRDERPVLLSTIVGSRVTVLPLDLSRALLYSSDEKHRKAERLYLTS